MESTTQKQRIAWLDIAKGIAILSTIIGHTTTFGSQLRNIIFSFHMPLFFAAAGYTIRPVAAENLAKVSWKDFKRLYIPVFVTRAICFVVDTFLYGNSITSTLWGNVRCILWGNGDYTLPGGYFMNGVGVCWFLIVLFWCRLFYRIVLIKIQNYRPIFLLFLALAGMWVGSFIWLPQSFDLVPVGMLFMEGGYQLRQSGKEDSSALKAAGVAGFFVWIYFTWTQGIYIELSTRSYPYSMLSIFIAFIACLAVIQFSKAVEGFRSASFLTWVGKYSLDLLCIHHLDWSFPFWNITTFSSEGSLAFLNLPLSTVYRLIQDIFLLFLWIKVKNLVLRLYHRKGTASSV